jgi:hypothetical protein
MRITLLGILFLAGLGIIAVALLKRGLGPGPELPRP